MYATRLSAGGVADEWVTQMLRQGDAQVFKKDSQMKLQMKREALEKLNRRASEMASATGNVRARSWFNERISARFAHGRGQKQGVGVEIKLESAVLSMLFGLGRLAQLVRAPALQAGGRRFESCTAHHINQLLTKFTIW